MTRNGMGLLLALMMGWCVAMAGPPADLAGLWKAKRRFGPDVRGSLSLAREGSGWRARISGHSAPVQFSEGSLELRLAGGQGEFRGRLETDGSRITGHWIQPATVRSGNRFASPVDLVPDGADRWIGQVTPLDDQMTFFLVVTVKEDGSVGAFLRNPERNLGIFLPIDRVTREGQRILFQGGDDVLFEGILRSEGRRLSIDLPFAGGGYDFVRVEDGADSGFLPRGAGAGSSVHRTPPAGADGWPTASLEEVGMSPGPIQELVDRIAATPVDSVRAPYLHALLVARHGKLVVEEYFHGFHRDELHDTRSASKSLTSTLVGIAIRDGDLRSVDEPVYSLIDGGRTSPDLDPRKRDMTVEHLMTMTSGFDCDDNDPESPGNEDAMQSQRDEPDWYRYTLSLPMKRPPGAAAVYCSANSNLLGDVLGHATGRWLPDVFRDRFARPLQIHRYAMNLTPTGEAYMGGGIYWLPRDFLKLGQLYLDEGVWKGRRILDAGWVEEATRPREHLNEQGYGYSWWVISYPFRDRTVRAFYAGGNGGQMVIVVPELDLAVLVMAGNYSHFASLLKFRDEYVGGYVLRAVNPDVGEGPS